MLAFQPLQTLGSVLPWRLSVQQILQFVGWGRRIGEQFGEPFALLLNKDEIRLVERIAL